MACGQLSCRDEGGTHTFHATCSGAARREEKIIGAVMRDATCASMKHTSLASAPSLSDATGASMKHTSLASAPSLSDATGASMNHISLASALS
jgi:hypothetical protein